MSFQLLGTSIIGRERGRGSDAAGYARAAHDGAVLEPLYLAGTLPELEQACRLAREAYPAYSALPAQWRGEFLREIALGIEGLGDVLVERVGLETALPPGRIKGESARTCHQLRMFADLIEEGSWIDARIESGDSARQPLPKPELRSMLIPLGPVAVFCAGNFPLAYSVAGGDTASALAAGCPVIVNAHHGHFGTAEMVGTVIQQAAIKTRMPDGVFSLLYGAGTGLGQSLVRHPAIRAVGFTGSQAGGRALADLAAARPSPIPVYAEMSSVNPVFILSAALRERWGDIAAGLHASITGGGGQFCTKPGLIFLPAGREADQFAAKLASLIGETPSTTMLNEGIAANFANRRAHLGSLATVQSIAVGQGEQAGLYLTTARAFRENGVMHEEVFGPVALVIACDGPADMAACAESLAGQLTATIHAEGSDGPAAQALFLILAGKAGRLIYNGYPTGLEVGQATVHGGPYPATTDGRSTSVGTAAITRWVRPIAFQNLPESMLPSPIRNANPRGRWRLINGKRTQAAVGAE